MKHKHHIRPVRMGGTNDQSNLIELNMEEHANAHEMLFYLYGQWQDKVAWHALAGMIGKEEIILATQSQSPSAETRAKHSASMKGRVPWNKGLKTRKHTAAERAAQSARQKGKPCFGRQHY